MSNPTPVVLVVDDMAIERINVSKILSKSSPACSVVEAPDGEKGYNLAVEIKPKLILLDVVMSNWNGFQTLRALKRNAETKNIPVIMVTTKDLNADRTNAEDCGAAGYVVKPASERALLTEVNKYLSA